MLVEVLLELLVTEVDAELLERVDLENFETENVKGIDGARADGALRGSHTNVDLLDDPVEEVRVNLLGEGVAVVGGLLKVEGNLGRGLSADHHGTVGTGLLEILAVHLQELGADIEAVLVGDNAGVRANGRVLARLEIDVPQVQHRRDEAKDVLFVLLGKSHLLHGLDHLLPLLKVVNVVHRGAAALAEVVVVLCVPEGKLLLEIGVRAADELVEDVEAALAPQLVNDTGLLQKVVDHGGTRDTRAAIEEDGNQLTEAGRVVVPQGLGVSESLQNRVGQQDVLLHSGRRSRALGKEHEALLGGLRLASPGLAGDKDGLVLLIIHEVPIRRLGDVEHMRRHVAFPLVDVVVDNGGGVQRKALERVHGNKNRPDVGVDLVVVEAKPKVVLNHRL
mmetsp:Transcript_30373/g.84969  ORF Transcript_30373/g.84969 Transcript_30373/m.84969 type:complete len:392 (+) Transcript_30373:2522-3697(+)